MSLSNVFEKINQSQKSGANLRQQNFDFFKSQGLPTKSNEAWHYTSLKHLTDSDLEPEQENLLSEKDLRQRLSNELNSDFFNLVFVNGIFRKEFSDIKSLAPLKLSFSEDYPATATGQAIEAAKKSAGKIQADSVEALRSAFTNETLIIEVPTDTSLAKPLHLIHFSSTEKSVYSKILLHLQSGSKLSFIESFIGDDKKYLTNASCEFLIEDSANLEFARVQSESLTATHLGCSRFFLKKNSSLETLSYAAGGILSRHDLEIYCLGEQASAKVNGLTLSSGTQHFDNHTLIDHVVGACNTTQLYKSILDGQSRAVFNGRVHIRAGAQKASSEQLNNNLLLSSKAEADSKPELGIYADDVKATHGSTVGQLDAEEIFYFLSRAIPRAKAIEMLSLGFVKEIIDRVSHPLIQSWLQDRLLQAYQKMKVKS